MDITQLRYFRTVSDTGSFTRAAEQLHMTQSALSKSIAKLEDEIGLRLFEREGNRIILNRFGQRFLQDSEPVLSHVSDCVRAVREMAGLERGDVRIAISKEVFLDHLIRQFLIDHPDVSFHCYLLSTEQMLSALEDGSIDLAVTSNPPVGPGILQQVLYEDQLEVMVGACHPLAGNKSLRVEQLRDERFIVTNSNYNMDNIIQQLCVQAGFTPKILYEGTSPDMPMYFIIHGNAVMITPHSISMGVGQMIPRNDNVIRIPLENEYPDMRKSLVVAFKEGHYQSAASQSFYDRMVEFYSSIQ